MFLVSLDTKRNQRKDWGIPQVDKTGKRFNELTVLSFAGRYRSSEKGPEYMHWKCLCDCGNIVILSAGTLSKNISCGCKRAELTAKSLIKYGTRTADIPEYQTWSSIKARCYRKSHIKYKNYGARGITVCDRWRKSFDDFLADMGPKPTPKHSIDRINVNGNYEPGNCRWANPSEQANNKTTTRVIQFEGIDYSMRALSEKLGCKYTRLQTLHVRQGRSMDEIMKNNLLHL